MIVSRHNSIFERLPRIYNYYDKDSTIYQIIRSISAELDDIGKEQEEMMRSHWVDTAIKTDLDNMGSIFESNRIIGEDDRRYRARLKRTVNEYMGGGTVLAIQEAVKALIRAYGTNDVKVIENPPETMVLEKKVVHGDNWIMKSSSVEDAIPRITISIEEAGEVSVPIIEDIDNNKTIAYNGDLRSMQKLVLTPGHAELDGRDVTKKTSMEEFPSLLRKGSKWGYHESLSTKLGTFDVGRFDEHMFTTGIPNMTLRFEWTTYLPSTFEVQIKSEALKRGGFDVKSIENFVNMKKAAGVKSIIKIIEG
jgi:hypothetical protein